MAWAFRDISDKGRKANKKLRYEVCGFLAENQEQPEVYAKFAAYGDAFRYAKFLTEAPVYHYEILIRS